jgi:hypothetical protein
MRERKTRGAAAALVVAAGIASIHHVYGGLLDGDYHRLLVPLLVAVFLALTFGSLAWFKHTGSRIALSVFTILALSLFSGILGVLHGGYAHLYKDILFLRDGPAHLYYPLNPHEHYPPDDMFFEVHGVLDIVTGYVVARSTFHLHKGRAIAMKEPTQNMTAPRNEFIGIALYFGFVKRSGSHPE